MIRHGDWKLNYYYGQPSQLFNLKDDPNELQDKTDDPKCQDIKNELTKKVLDGWNPEKIKLQMEEKQLDTQILGRWTRNTQPVDQYRWNLLPEMDYLD